MKNTSSPTGEMGYTRSLCKPSHVWVLLLVAVFGLFAANAQQNEQVVWHGILHDGGGAPIPGATVVLTSDKATAHINTRSDGTFQLAPQPADQYRLTVQINGNIIESAQTVELAAAMQAAVLTLSSRGEITVDAMKGADEAATGGEQLSSQAVSSLPLNKRDFSSLLLLAAGTRTDTNGAKNFTAQFAINGQRGVEATFAMDGADISDPEIGGATFTNFDVDAVEGIQSSSGWMRAEIGRGASGFTNIITRSGASGFHGSAFEFVRNYFDHATPAYPGRIPPFRRNEFGFTNGGPLYLPHVYDGRKRTFYFGQFQSFRQVLGTTQVLPVPTAQERAGIDAVTYADGSADTLKRPCQSENCGDPGPLPATHSSYGRLSGADLRNAIEGDNECRPVLVAHRPRFLAEGPILCAIQLRQSDGAHDES